MYLHLEFLESDRPITLIMIGNKFYNFNHSSSFILLENYIDKNLVIDFDVEMN
jgi:hypothetical protein